MKSRFWIYTLAAALAILILALWPRAVRQASNSELTKGSVARSTNTSVYADNSTMTSRPVADPSSYSPRVSSENTAKTNSEDRGTRIRQLVEKANVPIAFYGMVVDQDSNAIAGTTVTFKLRSWSFAPPGGSHGNFRTITKTSDGSGLFGIESESGDVLEIESIEKPGFEVEPSARRGFGYNTSEQFKSDPNDPVIFKMWRTNIHEQLITGQKSFHISPDGRTYFIDLTKGTITESGQGDIKVWVKRPQQITVGQRYDWSCRVDAVNGGLLQENDPASAMYSAPTNGYLQSFQYEQTVGGGWGDSTGPKRFYVMLNNGQVYGRITVDLFAYYNDGAPGMVRIQYAINPSGSRILR